MHFNLANEKISFSALFISHALNNMFNHSYHSIDLKEFSTLIEKSAETKTPASDLFKHHLSLRCRNQTYVKLVANCAELTPDLLNTLVSSLPTQVTHLNLFEFDIDFAKAHEYDKEGGFPPLSLEILTAILTGIPPHISHLTINIHRLDKGAQELFRTHLPATVTSIADGSGEEFWQRDSRCSPGDFSDMLPPTVTQLRVPKMPYMLEEVHRLSVEYNHVKKLKTIFSSLLCGKKSLDFSHSTLFLSSTELLEDISTSIFDAATVSLNIAGNNLCHDEEGNDKLSPMLALFPATLECLNLADNAINEKFISIRSQRGEEKAKSFIIKMSIKINKLSSLQTLNLASNELGHLSPDALKMLMKNLPESLISLNLAGNLFREFNGDMGEVVSNIPNSTKALDVSHNDLKVDQILIIIQNLPTSIKCLKISQHLFEFCTGGMLEKMPKELFMKAEKLVRSIPNHVTALTFPFKNPVHFTAEELQKLLISLPSTVLELDFQFNDAAMYKCIKRTKDAFTLMLNSVDNDIRSRAVTLLINVPATSAFYQAACQLVWPQLIGEYGFTQPTSTPVASAVGISIPKETVCLDDIIQRALDAGEVNDLFKVQHPGVEISGGPLIDSVETYHVAAKWLKENTTEQNYGGIDLGTEPNRNAILHERFGGDAPAAAAGCGEPIPAEIGGGIAP